MKFDADLIHVKRLLAKNHFDQVQNNRLIPIYRIKFGQNKFSI